MGEARRKRKKAADAAVVDKLIDAQAPAPLIKQGDIPPNLNVYATMDAAWQDLAQGLVSDLPKKQREDAKFIFFHGVQAAANLMIYCAGQARFELAADQITQDCIAYEKEAEAVLAERRQLADEPFPAGAKTH